MTIKIKRRLHDGIYRSQGGGEVRTVREWKNTNARNLVAAAKLLPEVYDSSIKAYGNIGAGVCWIEVDGVELDDSEMSDINNAREWRKYDRHSGIKLPTATEYAARLIADMRRPVVDGQHRSLASKP